MGWKREGGCERLVDCSFAEEWSGRRDQIKSSRERRRERETLRVDDHPALTGWANLCRIYGAG